MSVMEKAGESWKSGMDEQSEWVGGRWRKETSSKTQVWNLQHKCGQEDVLHAEEARTGTGSWHRCR